MAYLTANPVAVDTDHSTSIQPIAHNNKNSKNSIASRNCLFAQWVILDGKLACK